MKLDRTWSCFIFHVLKSFLSDSPICKDTGVSACPQEAFGKLVQRLHGLDDKRTNMAEGS